MHSPRSCICHLRLIGGGVEVGRVPDRWMSGLSGQAADASRSVGSPSLERCGRGTSATASCCDPGYGYPMALVIPWLLEREYQQHRNLDYYGLPETFEEWHDTANALADQLSRVTGRRVVKVVIHPGELEEWARRQGRVVSAQVRSRFAEMLWQADNAGLAT